MLAGRQMIGAPVSSIDFSADELGRLRTALGRISRLVDRQVSGGGLTRTQLSVLGVTARTGPIGVGELAEVEGVNPTMLSRVVGKLETMGLLRRSPHPDDARVVRVEVTPAGRRLHQRLRRERATLLGERIADLPEGHAESLLGALPALEALAAQLARVRVAS
jgi:DNA-binding MarR family transcriptional regulator